MFVTFSGWYENPTNSTIFIAMEYFSESDLHSYIRRDQAQARNHCREIVTQILKALEVMHALDMCHSGLQPSVCLLPTALQRYHVPSTCLMKANYCVELERTCRIYLSSDSQAFWLRTSAYRLHRPSRGFFYSHPLAQNIGT